MGKINSQKIIIRFLIVGIIVFLLMNVSSLGSYTNKLSGDYRQEPIPTVYGKMGNNNWYISDVTISFSYDPLRVREIQYCLDDIWYIYFGPFNVTKDGIYMMQWLWIELSGRPHNGIPIDFKLDQSPPVMQLTKKSEGKNKVIFTATAVDEVSEIEAVEFYLDDVLNQTVNESPYQYIWIGEEKHTVYAIGYNFAGLSEKSNNLSTTIKPHFRNHNLMQRFFILFQTLLLRFCYVCKN